MASDASPYNFTKMQALGNDFVIFDARKVPISLKDGNVQRIAARRFGVGCDQVIILRESDESEAAARMQIYNADGSETEACGNGTSCVAELLMSESSASKVVLQIGKRDLTAWRDEPGWVSVDMGVPLWELEEIPISWERAWKKGVDLLEEGIDLLAEVKKDFDFSFVNMGNPHMVLWRKLSGKYSGWPLPAATVMELGSKIEKHPMFPQGINVEFAKYDERKDELRLQVWERGCGITPACGSGACAALVASARHGLCPRRVRVCFMVDHEYWPQGDDHYVGVDWQDDDHVVMSGPASVIFRGSIDLP